MYRHFPSSSLSSSFFPPHTLFPWKFFSVSRLPLSILKKSQNIHTQPQFSNCYFQFPLENFQLDIPSFLQSLYIYIMCNIPSPMLAFNLDEDGVYFRTWLRGVCSYPSLTAFISTEQNFVRLKSVITIQRICIQTIQKIEEARPSMELHSDKPIINWKYLKSKMHIIHLT